MRAVAAWARATFDVATVAAVGVSYGALLAAAAAARFDDVDAVACVSFPTDYLWFLTAFAASKYARPASTKKTQPEEARRRERSSGEAHSGLKGIEPRDPSGIRGLLEDDTLAEVPLPEFCL